MKYCSECGHQLEYQGNYCTECGTKTQGKSNDDAKIKYENTVVHDTIAKILQQFPVNRLLSNKKLLLGIGISLLLIIILATIGGKGLGKDSPTHIAEAFIDHSRNSEWEEAEKLWSQSGKDYLLAQLFNDERMIYQTIRNLTHRTDGDLDEYEITNEEINGEEAVVNANFIFAGGRREKAMFAMIKEDGKWKVFAFQSGSN
jgi:uncharacterized membrane protein YvbJ